MSTAKDDFTFIGWQENRVKPASSNSSLQDDSMLAFYFITIYTEDEDYKKLQYVIDNYYWVIGATDLEIAMNNALKVGATSSIAVLMRYVDIFKPHYLETFLQVNTLLNPRLTNRHINAMQMLQKHRPGFLERIYHIEDEIDKTIYQQVVEFLDIIKVQKKLEENIPQGTESAGGTQGFRV